MEQILVKRNNGDIYYLEDLYDFRTIKSINQKIEIRVNDVIEIEIESANFFDFKIGDTFYYFSKKYTLNQLPKIEKVHNNLFRFYLIFEGIQFDLRRVSYDVNTDTTGSAVYGETLTANLELFLRVLVSNANRVFGGTWEIGNFPDNTETKTITFSEEENCLNVLQTICEEYNTDFIIETIDGINIINIQQIGREIPLEFKVGFQKGLYNLSREKVDSSDIITRLKVYGSSRNLGAEYRANRLVLKDKNKGSSYVDNQTAIAKYGIYESTKIFEDIYPRRKGVVTAVSDNSIYKFSDNSMDFDLKQRTEDKTTTSYLLPGVSAKIHFNTGSLAGYEFEISDYNHQSKEFTIIKYNDANDYQFPSKDSEAFRISVGDEYVILDIRMPQVYIDNAEQELLEKGTEFLSDKQEPLVQYSLDIDTLYLQRILNETVSEFFKVGDFVKVIDDDLELNRFMRIKTVERDLEKPFDYKLTLSDAKVTTSIVSNIVNDIYKINKVIKINNLSDYAKAKRNWKDAQEVLDMIFDVEGDYYTDRIKPNSIETIHLQVGAKSMQFTLLDSRFEPNFEGDPNKIVWKDCRLVHYTISETITEWSIEAGQKVLEANKPYYMYARCNKSNRIGVIEITEEQYTVDGGDYYYFLIGIINSYDVDILAREISLMYGFTTISGRFIKTGRIQSADGNTFFDLDTGEISGRITFTEDSPIYEQLFNGIKIGAENLLLGTDKISSYYDIVKEKASRYSGSILDYVVGVDINHNTIEDLCLYVLGKNKNDEGVSLGYLTHSILSPGVTQRLFARFKADLGDLKRIYLVITREATDEVLNIEYRNIKLELGNIPTDYSKSQLDISDINDERIRELEKKTSFMNTTISGNIIATGLLMVGDVNGANAGISGFTDNSLESVRFWSGALASDRYNAPFRVLDNGKVYMENAYVKGEIVADRGIIGGFNLVGKVLQSNSMQTGVWFSYENDRYSTSVALGNNIGEGISQSWWSEAPYYPSLVIKNYNKFITPISNEEYKGGIHIDIKNIENPLGIQAPAIHITNGYIRGFSLSIDSISTNETANREADILFLNVNNNGDSVYLPDDAQQGKVIKILSAGANINNVVIRTRESYIGRKYLQGKGFILNDNYTSGEFVFSGNTWLLIN